VHIYEGPVAPQGRNLKLGPGRWNHYAWLIQKGTAEVRQDGKVVHAGSGDWLIVYPGKRWQQFSPDARIISVHFQVKWPDGCNLFEDGLSVVLPSKRHPGLEKAARRILTEMGGVFSSDPVQIQRTAISVSEYFRMQHFGLGFVSTLIDVLTEQGLAPARVGHIDDRLLTVQHRLDQCPLDRTFEENASALFSGWVRDTLNRRFQHAFGVTPAHYFESRRRDYALRLLGYSTTPIKEIAGNLGYRSLADFSSWFKRAHGQSPRAYRHSVEVI
jgi:AraC-like DNA-binding protein